MAHVPSQNEKDVMLQDAEEKKQTHWKTLRLRKLTSELQSELMFPDL